jgi:hypothetical protein
MSPDARNAIVTVVIAGNVFVALPCLYLGCLGLAGLLSDTSVSENRLMGGQFLGFAAISLLNSLGFLMSRKPLRAAVYCLNAILVLFGIEYWLRLGAAVHPLNSAILFLFVGINVGTDQLCARWRVADASAACKK